MLPEGIGLLVMLAVVLFIAAYYQPAGRMSAQRQPADAPRSVGRTCCARHATAERPAELTGAEDPLDR